MVFIIDNALIGFAQQYDKLIFVRERLSSRASAASRGIYAFRFAFWLIWCEDPSTPLRSAQDDKVFCCLRLPEKHQFTDLLSRADMRIPNYPRRGYRNCPLSTRETPVFWFRGCRGCGKTAVFAGFLRAKTAVVIPRRRGSDRIPGPGRGKFPEAPWW